MRVKVIPIGMLQTNCYLLADEQAGVCAVIDPGARSERLLEAIAAEGWRVSHILLTHGHFDHVLAAPAIQRATGAALYISPRDEWMLDPAEASHPGYIREPYEAPRVDGHLCEGDTLELGSLRISVIGTPGHTAGSVTLRCGDVLFTGDTLFCESCGRTDLESGSMEQMFSSLRRLAQLEGNFRVLPGHEEGSTLAHEREANPYLREALRR